MSWKKRVFTNFKLYAVTDLKVADPEILKKIAAAYRGGADIVQLRSKTLSDAALYRLGLRIRKIADRYRKLFFVNDRPDLALVLEADGVHIGQDDLPVAAVRRFARRAGQSLWIGKSTHSLRQALEAVKEKPDYIGVGPVYSTPTKRGVHPVGLKLIRDVSARIKIPFVAIGGIDLENIDQVLEAGARRIAVVRAVFNAKDVSHASLLLIKKIKDAYKS